MIQPALIALKNYILTANPYFNTGFDDVYMDETKGVVGNDLPVFPNDKIGDYFYLRLPSQVRFNYTAASAISDCANTPNIEAELMLVACVRKADASILMTNLTNTISMYNDSARFTNARYRSEDVVLQELGRMKKENTEAALARLGNHTIVSLSFVLSVPFTLTKCITDPCSCS